MYIVAMFMKKKGKIMLKIIYKKTDELLPYVNNARTHSDAIVKRWQDYTGKQASLESTGEPYGSHT